MKPKNQKLFIAIYITFGALTSILFTVLFTEFVSKNILCLMVVSLPFSVINVWLWDKIEEYFSL